MELVIDFLITFLIILITLTVWIFIHYTQPRNKMTSEENKRLDLYENIQKKIRLAYGRVFEMREKFVIVEKELASEYGITFPEKDFDKYYEDYLEIIKYPVTPKLPLYEYEFIDTKLSFSISAMEGILNTKLKILNQIIETTSFVKNFLLKMNMMHKLCLNKIKSHGLSNDLLNHNLYKVLSDADKTKSLHNLYSYAKNLNENYLKILNLNK